MSNEFKRSIYWNSYQTIPAKVINKGTNIYELLSASFQCVKRLFVLAYVIVADAANNEVGIKKIKYFLPSGEIKNYNVLIDGRNFYDQPINDLIKQYDEVRDVSIGFLLDYAYFKGNYRLIAVDLSNQKALSNSTNSISRSCWRS